MASSDRLYKALGKNIREGRERITPKISQEKLASTLGVSRTSIVNIEAGRQHAPLHLLWKIADVIGVDISTLIPSRDDLASTYPVELDNKLMKQIARVAEGDEETAHLSDVVSQLRSSMDTTKVGRERP